MHHDQTRDARSTRSVRSAATTGRASVRWDRVLELRAQISAGTYPLERWWTLAVDPFLVAVEGSEPTS